MPAKRAEKREKSAAGEEQAGCVNQAGEAALVNRGYWIQTGMLLLVVVVSRSDRNAGIVRRRRITAARRRQRNVNKHLRIVGRAFRGAANGNCERKIVRRIASGRGRR